MESEDVKEDVRKDIEQLKIAQATQAATQAGAVATLSATQAGAAFPGTVRTQGDRVKQGPAASPPVMFETGRAGGST